MNLRIRSYQELGNKTTGQELTIGPSGDSLPWLPQVLQVIF
ncbi:MAG: hypothetical protein PWR29_1816 [Methanolobus sp.]|jgi:hypothetical protein|nr:hypothetical protein [Methanolobus sp.]